MKSDENPLIVVGLGISGLMVAYIAQKRNPGRRIIGIERDNDSGGYLSGSFGVCRSWLGGGKEWEWSRGVWADIEEEVGQLVKPTGGLIIKQKNGCLSQGDTQRYKDINIDEDKEIVKNIGKDNGGIIYS